jgi:hypothetical protein
MARTRRILGLVLLFAAAHAGCINSSYQPVSRGTAKLTYKGRAATVKVDEASAPVSAFDSDYVDLFQDEPRELADSSHSQRITGFTLSLVGAVGTIASLFIPEDLSDMYEVDTARGQIGLGVLIGAVVVGAIGGMFETSADVKLNDAINMHNDRYLAGLAAAQSAGAYQVPATLPPAPEPAPQSAPVAPQQAPATPP